MIPMKYATLATLAVIIATLLGCTSRQDLAIPDYKSPVTAGKARVIIARPESGLTGCARSWSIYDGNTKIGGLAQGSFLVWDRSPGEVALQGAGNKMAFAVTEKSVTCIEFKLGMDLGMDITMTIVDPRNYDSYILLNPPEKTAPTSVVKKGK